MKNMVEEFQQFDADHPDIWKLFVNLTQELIRAGHKHGSADAVLHRIRWHYLTSTQDQFPKINNNYAAFYSRKFADQFPEHKDFFARRKSAADFLPEFVRKPCWLEGKLFEEART